MISLKNIFPIVFLSFFFLASAKCDAQSFDTVEEALNSMRDMRNKPAPLFSATTLSGKKIALEKLKGKVVFLNFWSLSCSACFKELPDLNKMAEKYAGMDFTLISVMDNTPEQLLKKFELAEHGYKIKKPVFGNDRIDFEIIPAGDEIMKSYLKLRIFPTNFVIDQQGVVREANGYMRDLGVPEQRGTTYKYCQQVDTLLGIAKPEIKTHKTLQEGDVVMEFFASDKLDSLVSIRDFSDRFVHLIFWNSLQEQQPEDRAKLKAALDQHSKTKDQEAVLLNVCLNCEREAWFSFVELHQLPGIHLYTQGSWGGKLIKEFTIQNSPSYFYLGPENKLIRTGL